MDIIKKIKKVIAPILISFVFILMVGCASNNTSEVKNKTDVKAYNNETEINTENLSSSESEQAKLHFINTGNSDAILIKKGDKAALIDGGDNDDEGSVVNYLKNQGVTELEYVFATHPHADHIGGLDAVVKEIPVKNIYVSNGDANTKTYSDFINAMADKGLNPSVPLLNSEFKLGTSTFKVLSVANSDDPNNNSIVLEYKNGNDKVLLMGDAESEIESKINVEDVDLLKVGHHGSHSSSTPSFINKANPEYAVITVGEDNKYGHPHIETMDTLKSNNIEVHRSDECGDIIFTSTGNGLKVECKKGSYKSGKEKGYTANSNNGLSKNNYSTSLKKNTIEAKPQQKIENSTNLESVDNTGETVYWTLNGKSYHTTSSCPTLSRSKTILSGTQSESGKIDPCDKCH
jgi:competence protein ComEC